MKQRVWNTRKILLIVIVFVSTLMIEFILVFMQGCSDGVGLGFDMDKQTFFVRQGCVCGGDLSFSSDDGTDCFSVGYNRNVHAFWYDSYNPSALEINNLPSCCSVVQHGDTLSLRRLPLRANTVYSVYRASGCRVSPAVIIRTDRRGRVVCAQ
ncbi:hypothetical protein J5A51_01020 [Prevotella fusca JCM 17724]|uniref:Uncharacterized protein n=1 Tax=Prevotella fusca JCM 17724 TaxID=1236517 RepID=A0A0K1NNJ4_9BACT|nr:hypothetical protein [Prevotella fusca]AKU70256.1 hypothetical protein ADJ77_10760 [Prevotella fusca JCM 17724]QUB85877.1 hypothetical protein J5A51_01020 [Prevotella fusca JCM 17724]